MKKNLQKKEFNLCSWLKGEKNLSHQAPSFLSEALIRSNVPCQIRQLINQGRDQSSPLTDGEMEAGHWWRHFLSTSLTFSSAINWKQNKIGLDCVGEADSLWRFFKDLFTCSAKEASIQPPTEKKTDFCADVSVYMTAYTIFMQERSLNIQVAHFLRLLFEASWTHCTECLNFHWMIASW